jgi:hypothetical protein
MLSDMLTLLIVVTALALGAIGLRAERNRRVIELWLCNAAASALVVATVAGHAAGRVG